MLSREDEIQRWSYEHRRVAEIQPVPFEAGEGQTLLHVSAKGAFQFETDPPRGTHVQIASRAGIADIHVNGCTVPYLHLEHKEVRLHGPGTINVLTTIGDHPCKVTLASNLEIECIETGPCPKLTLFASQQVKVGVIYPGNTELELPKLVRVDALAVDHQIRIVGTLSCGTLDGHDVTVVSGVIVLDKLGLDKLGRQRITINSGAVLELRKHADGAFVNLNGGQFRVQGDPASGHGVDGAIAEGITFTGQRGTIEVDTGHLVIPRFEGRTKGLLLRVTAGMVTFPYGEPFALEVGGQGSVMGPSGVPVDTGLRLSSVKVHAGAKAIEAVNFFVLDPVFVPQLASVQRVTAWWPSTRKRAITEARRIGCGLPFANHQPAARAHHWSTVEALLIDKSAPGAIVATAHELAQDAQRRVSSWRSAERTLLELNRVMGYSTRLLRPITIWCAIAALFAFAIHLVAAKDPCLLGCGTNDLATGLELYWDMLVSPVSFVRPIPEDSLLGEVIADNLLGKILAFGGRAIGTWCLIASTLAMRRYLRHR